MTDIGANDHTGAATDSTSVTVLGQHRILFIGEEPVPVRSVPQCIACQTTDADRAIIEQGIISMRSYRSIAEAIPRTSDIWVDKRAPDHEASVDLVIRRISEHSRLGHGNADQVVARSVMEAVARQQGIDPEAMVGTIIHEFGVLTEVQRQGFEDFIASDKPVPLGMTLKATEMLLRYKEVAQGADGSQFQRAIDSVFRIMAKNLGQDELQWVYSQMESDPDIQTAFKALAQQSQA